MLQKKFLDCFVKHNFSWFLTEERTRRRLVGSQLQEATVDQVLCNNAELILHIERISPLGRSGHLCLKITLNVKESVEMLSTVQKKQWSRLSTEDIIQSASKVEWCYSSNTSISARFLDGTTQQIKLCY